MKKKKIHFILTILSAVVILFCAVCGFVLGSNVCVKYVGGENIVTAEVAKNIDGADCILILGCGVKPNGQPSNMLTNRLKRGIELYNDSCAPKIIMSGDHGRKEYDEVNTMKKIAIDSGISSEDVFMDHAGFSTYESIYRAKEIFKAEKIIVVSQEYHLYRALYIAKKLGVEAYGVSSDYHMYRGQAYREIREITARCKDFLKVIGKPEPTYLGESIPVSGNGDLTND